MAKNKKSKSNKQNGKQAGRSETAPSKRNNNSFVDEKLKKIEQETLVHVQEGDAELIKDSEPDPEPMSPEELVEKASEVLAYLKLQRKRCDEKERELDKSLEKSNEDRDAIKAEKQDLEKKAQTCDSREKTLEEQERLLNERHEAIQKREADADAGFSKRNRESMENLDKELADVNQLLANHRIQIELERSSWDQELETRKKKLEKDCERKRTEFEIELLTRRKDFESECDAIRNEIHSEKEAMDLERKKLRKERDNYDLDRELFDEDKSAFDEKVNRKAAREIELKENEIRELNDRLAAARERAEQLSSKLMEHEEASRRFGHMAPTEVLKKLEETEKERDQLRKDIDALPSTEQAQRLYNLEREKEVWASERFQLKDEIGQLKQSASRYRIAVTEMESLRDEKLSLESGQELLRETNRQLRSEVDQLIKGSENKSPFPACTQMDQNNELQSSPSTLDEIKDLVKFTEYVRNRMKLDKGLCYSLKDVRSFIAGLSMSRLHLLQGISGTGKTSLPLAFARAIGAGDTLIEVQAGWRDRHDLIGHYNSFEKKFYELEFLQALYKAQCPKYKDIPYIVVLDEMNLSHPEQYFADLLSALEQEPARRRLALMQSSCDPAPFLLDESGKYIKIPDNIWFVGTANHDETTKDFADKTYDRAHMMELPRHREQFDINGVKSTDPISLNALNTAFETAKDKYENESARAYRFLEEEVGETLWKKFRVGWGNRLERQMKDYVPVVMGCGGSIGEAVDHILATKLLRKIRDRYDNRDEHVISLRGILKNRWDILDSQSIPEKSMDICNRELERLGHSEE